MGHSTSKNILLLFGNKNKKLVQQQTLKRCKMGAVTGDGRREKDKRGRGRHSKPLNTHTFQKSNIYY